MMSLFMEKNNFEVKLPHNLTILMSRKYIYGIVLAEYVAVQGLIINQLVFPDWVFVDYNATKWKIARPNGVSSYYQLIYVFHSFMWEISKYPFITNHNRPIPNSKQYTSNNN